MVFPSNMVDGKMTINWARGCHTRITDRFDLTVECIRRHYQGGDSPPLRAGHVEYASYLGLAERFVLDRNRRITAARRKRSSLQTKASA